MGVASSRNATYRGEQTPYQDLGRLAMDERTADLTTDESPTQTGDGSTGALGKNPSGPTGTKVTEGKTHKTAAVEVLNPS